MIVAYVFLLLSIQQAYHVAIGTPVEELNFDKLKHTYYEVHGVSENLPPWLENCKNLSETAHEVLKLAANVTTWLYHQPITIVKDLMDLEKCHGLFKPICITKGLMTVVYDLQSVETEIREKLKITDSLFKDVIIELLWCLLNLAKDTRDPQLMEQLLKELST